MRYRLVIKGRHLTASAHSITDPEEDRLLLEMLNSNGESSIDMDLDEVQSKLEGWDEMNGNSFVIDSHPMMSEDVIVELEGEDGSTVWEVEVGQLNSAEELWNDYDLWKEVEDNHGEGFDEPPCADALCWEANPRVLVFEEIAKSVSVTDYFDTGHTPVLEEFGVIKGTLETNDKDIPFLGKLWYKDTLLRFTVIDEVVIAQNINYFSE